MTDTSRSTITLRARDGAPLSDPQLRDTVVATAHAIAERTGVDLIAIDAGDDRVHVVLATSRLGAIGFAAELRRLTERWYGARSGGRSLWGAAPDEDEDWAA